MARLLLALAVFLAGLGGGAYWFLHRFPGTAGGPDNKANPSEVSAKSAPADDGFFYPAIGGADGEEEAELAAPEKKSAGGRTTYTIELLVTKDRVEAETLIDELKEQGLEAYYTPLSRAGHVVYRVRRGIFTTLKEADQAAAQLKLAAAPGAKVIKLQ